MRPGTVINLPTERAFAQPTYGGGAQTPTTAPAPMPTGGKVFASLAPVIGGELPPKNPTTNTDYTSLLNQVNQAGNMGDLPMVISQANMQQLKIDVAELNNVQSYREFIARYYTKSGTNYYRKDYGYQPNMFRAALNAFQSAGGGGGGNLGKDVPEKLGKWMERADYSGKITGESKVRGGVGGKIYYMEKDGVERRVYTDNLGRVTYWTEA